MGACAAYALTNAGYEVTLITAARVGDGATAGNAGLLVPADSVVWPGPTNARAVPATLLGRGDSNITVARTNIRTIPWGVRFLAHSTSQQYRTACRAAHALSAHSLRVAEKWASEAGATLTRTGMLFLVDSADTGEELRTTRQALQDLGETYVDLAQDELTAMDAAYKSLPQGIRPIYAAGAASGDSLSFTRALISRLSANGVRVVESAPVSRVLVTAGRTVGVQTAAGRIQADAVVLAAGVGTRALARTAGVRAPILPVKGYAVTVPISDAKASPTIGGVLESRHVAFSRMGDHLRLSTGAEIGRADHHVTADSRQALTRAGEYLFPGALDWGKAEFRAEHRPMTPGGLPWIGRTRVTGLYLAAGHGSLGWTQAAGSADLLSCLIAGTPMPVDPSQFQPISTTRRMRKALARNVSKGDDKV